MNYSYSTSLQETIISVNFETEWNHVIEVKDIFFSFSLFQASYDKCEGGREGGMYMLEKPNELTAITLQLTFIKLVE